jgi:hypothetical protein
LNHVKVRIVIWEKNPFYNPQLLTNFGFQPQLWKQWFVKPWLLKRFTYATLMEVNDFSLEDQKSDVAYRWWSFNEVSPCYYVLAKSLVGLGIKVDYQSGLAVVCFIL